MFKVMEASATYGGWFVVVSPRYHVWGVTTERTEADQIVADLNRRSQEGWK